MITSYGMKTFYFFLLLNIFTYSSFAQTFNYGLNLGYTNNEVFYTNLQPSTVVKTSNFLVNLKSGLSFGVTTKVKLDKALDFSAGSELFVRRISTLLGNGSSQYEERIGKLVEIKFPVKLIYKTPILDDHSLFWNNAGGISFTYLMPYDDKYFLNESGNSGEVKTLLEQNDQFGVELLLETGIYKPFKKFGAIVVGITYHYKASKDVSHMSYYKINTSNYVSSSSFRASFFSLDLTFYFRKNKDTLAQNLVEGN